MRWCRHAAIALGTALVLARPVSAQSADSLTALARAAAQRGDRDAAAAHYRAAIARDSNAVPALRELVTLLEADGRWQAAVPAAQRLARLTPTDAALELKVGQWLSWSGEPDSGVTHLRRAVALAPDSSRYRGALGQVLTWNAATRTEGIAALRRAVAARPPDRSAHRALAAALGWDAATRAEAVTRYAALVAETPRDAALVAEFGEVLSWQPARHALAEETLVSARRLARAADDTATAARAARALLHLQLWRGRPRAALSLADSLLAVAPADTSVVHSRASALLALGRASEATAALRALADAAPSDVGVREDLAYALAGSGRLAEARAVADRLPRTPSPNARDWIRRSAGPAAGVDFSVTHNSFGLTISRLTGTVSAAVAPRTRLSAFGRPTWFDSPAGGFRSQTFGGALDVSVSSTTSARAEVAVDRYVDTPDQWSGAVEGRRTLPRDGEVRLSARRSAVEDSRRSAQGLAVNGQVVGQVRANVLAVAVRTPALPGALHLDLAADAGAYTASTLRTNVRRQGSISLDRDLALGRPVLRLGAGVDYLGYTYDANRVGPATPVDEQGGYWSPRVLSSAFTRARVTVAATGRLTLQGGGSLNYRTAGNAVGARRTSLSFNGSARWVGTRGWDVDAGGFYIDNLTGFRMRQIGVGVRHAF